MPGDIIILHVYAHMMYSSVPEIWFATDGETDGWTDGQADRKSDL